ncbi:hypothetical protein [Aureimonas sp. AU4]|uniref:hypothetical protein n=1 Tax=Aureimonas sp. AU4 TaxID=1638163 RepID=UPI0012E38B01|nr:hypothetical protein [Aureimonas sp. AU4]
MLTTHSPWRAARPASSVFNTSNLSERVDAADTVTSNAPLAEPAADADQASRDAIEGRDSAKPANRRRAVGIMFGIDPSNLYEPSDDEQNRDSAVRDLD